MNNGTRTRSSPRYTDHSYESNDIRLGRLRIKPIYLYGTLAILLLVVLLAAVSLLTQALMTPLMLHIGMVGGVLLLLGNVRELIGRGHRNPNGTALMNTMIGGGLVVAWLAQLLSLALLWIPALLLLVIAAPLAFDRSTVYLTYVQVARNVAQGVRRTVRRTTEQHQN